MLVIALTALLALYHPEPASRSVLFPQASRARVFGAPRSIGIEVDQTHRVLAEYIAPDGRTVTTSQVADGGWLTQAEFDQLRSVVTPAGAPQPTAACCSPRHAFLFYDASGRYLGYLTVCFECGCAHIRPVDASRDPPGDIHWDAKALARIVLAHHLGPTVPPRPPWLADPR